MQTPLIDHHCHGVVTAELERSQLEALMSESYLPPPAGTSHFQKPLGLAIRRYCAPVLDLEPLASAEAYCARRAELGHAEVNRRLLVAGGVTAHLVDTGHRSTEISTPAQLAAISGHAVREVVRIESVAEEVAARGGSAEHFSDRFEAELRARAEQAVGFKSVVAYRTTFKIEQTPPAATEVAAAAGRWLGESVGRRPRLADPVLIRHGLWIAAAICRERRFPLQLHVGFGDPDVYMHACDPTHFTDFFRAMEAWGVAVTLLHNYPFVREAGWLAEIFQNVYYDVGAILNFTGPSCVRTMRDALEMGPFTKQLFSTDAFGLPELHFLGVRQFREALGTVLAEWLDAGNCTARDVDDIAALIGYRNAARIYPLGELPR